MIKKDSIIKISIITISSLRGGNNMFCPKCGYEYEENIKVCPDCNIPLVEKLDNKKSEEEMDYIDYEFLLSSYKPGDIAIMKSILECENINYFIQGELFSKAYAGGLQSVRFMVDESKIELARELLKDFI